MNRDDIIRMARETYGPHEFSEAGLIHLGHFAALVAAAEREACAKLCEKMSWYMDDGEECAAAIRARGQV